jgi:hypothetical protein
MAAIAAVVAMPATRFPAMGARQGPELEPAADDEVLILIVTGDRYAVPGSADATCKPR